MSKAAPVFLSVLLLFSILGYMTIYSISDDDSNELFTCDSGEQIPLELQNDGFEDCPDSSDEDVPAEREREKSTEEEDFSTMDIVQKCVRDYVDWLNMKLTAKFSINWTNEVEDCFYFLVDESW